MTIASFFKLVELRTKVASMIPFAIGTLYALYRFDEFNLLNFALMFISLLSFDMTTTLINNYYDFKKAHKTTGYGYEDHNAIVKFGIRERTVVTLLFTLLGIASVAGFLLFLNTSWLVLAIGGLSFLAGILYTFGPVPISRMPLGELFSGTFMGFIITFIAALIHTSHGQLLGLTLNLHSGDWTADLHIGLLEIVLLFGISIPAMLCIANIMLANNICDMEEDIANRRYTLPVYIGKPKALLLFRMLYYFSYVDIIFLLIIGVHPLLLALILLTIIPLLKNLKKFDQEQSKRSTFVLAVKNFVITSLARIVVLGVSVLLAAF
ncbi:1,4-dihydroxy-2-naphthoate polyprenyltransferase [Gorillibacterium massiliense]|uniref:1,4-dihydroxy-2-naphthoate polyprenyltransferase n=1 Tax=Gorillibacterium massiliense TaxID=1280390 RepID=UPI0004B1CB48|nr:1,4-dihydroxy-2-naphthoate polyprenyltransferase [Gorillibacterium massiliense]